MSEFFMSLAHIPVRMIVVKKQSVEFLVKKYSNYTLSKVEAPITIKLIEREGPSSYLYKKGYGKIWVASIIKNFRELNDQLRLMCAAMLPEHKGLLIHGSVMADKSGAYIFLGDEGAGKSTIRRILEKEMMCLGDDSAFVRVVSGEAYVFGSPLYQRTNMAYPNKRVKIKGFFGLSKANFEMVRSCDKEQGARLLLENAFLNDLSKKTKVKLFSLVFDLLSRSPCYVLDFRRNAHCATLIRSAQRLISTIRVDKIIRTLSSADIDKIYAPNAKWCAAIMPISTLFQVRVIDDVSWRFEFPDARLIKRIIRFIRQKNSDGKHIGKIRAFLQMPVRKIVSGIFVVYRWEKTLVLLDGNHRAVAIGTKEINYNVILRAVFGMK